MKMRGFYFSSAIISMDKNRGNEGEIQLKI
jgi:hypothetical protein